MIIVFVLFDVFFIFAFNSLHSNSISLLTPVDLAIVVVCDAGVATAFNIVIVVVIAVSPILTKY